jgi:two-component system, OmpR family, sensor histidine kinase KdpD
MTEQPVARGKLKLFLGYADGVGKTYAMFEAARQRKEEGVNALVGWVEIHGQRDSEALLAGMDLVPPRRTEAGQEEMDLETILALHPVLVLVDNLVHTNFPGGRHPRRYQDVEDLLAGGINVYATLNIQDLESLRDIVFQITGITVQESIPDSVFDQASIIEVIDLPPDELLQRYQDGKIYISPALAPRADTFYRLGHLLALRELTMRRAAGQIEDQMQAYMAESAIPGPWPASERLMVCVSAHPISERLVRAGQRLASSLNAVWFAVYIETPDRLRFSSKHHERVLQTLRLAEDLGARVVKISGRTVPETVIQFAQRQNITKIIIGKLKRPRWREILNGSVVEEIMRQSGLIDVYVVNDESALQKGTAEPFRLYSRWSQYLYGALLVAAATLLGVPLARYINPANLVMLYLAAVVLAAVYFGRGPSMLASLFSVLAFDYFLVHPQFSLSVSDSQYLLTFFGLLGVGLVISYLAGLVRDQVEASQQREVQTDTLYNLSRELTIVVDLPAILNTIIQQIEETFTRECAILLSKDQHLEIQAASSGLVLNENELAAASWAYEHSQPAGRNTDTLPEAGLRFLPLLTPRGKTGVLGVKPSDPGRHLSPEQRQFLEAYASLAALAIERAQLAEEASRVQINSATEKLQSALLNSISHDLRTPLATITGVFSSLAEADQGSASQILLQPAERRDLVETGWEEARRLNRLVGNLLDMTRLESGALKLRREEGDVQDLIGAALERLADRLRSTPVQTSLAPELPLVSVDFVLIEQVLVNLLDNAVKYSPPGSPIEIEARSIPNTMEKADCLVEISVHDHGSGIPPEDLDKVFDKFFRVQHHNNSAGGTGLGLAICKGIVEAHGGTISAENGKEGGAVMRFTLPMEEKAC